MIARAAEGSARDGLSILDQAIAHGTGRGRRRRGARHARPRRPRADPAVAGDGAERRRRRRRSTQLDEAHELGIDPTAIAARADGEPPRRDPRQGRGQARRAAVGRGARVGRDDGRQARLGDAPPLWQMLLKGLADVGIAPDPREAAEMALLRLIHSAELPDPAAIVARLSGKAAALPQLRPGVVRQRRPSPNCLRRFPRPGRAARAAGKHQLALATSTTRSGWCGSSRRSWR